MIFEQRAPHFYFALDPTNVTASPTLSIFFRMKLCLLVCTLESVLILITEKTLEGDRYEYICSTGNQGPMHADCGWNPYPFRGYGTNPCCPNPIYLPFLVTEKHQALETS